MRGETPMKTPLVKRSDLKVDAVFDIETSDWTNFVAGGLYDGKGYFASFGDPFALYREIIKHRHVWSHNGGRFDTLWAMDCARGLGHTIDFVSAGARVIRAEVTHPEGSTIFYDSKAVFPLHLKDLTSAFEVSKEELDLPCKCGESCGGYCQISIAMSAEMRSRMLDYLRADCVSLWNAIGKMRDFAASNDMDLCATIGSSAWRNVKRKLNLDDAWKDLESAKEVRKSYFGGRVECFRATSPEIVEYDVNSMYPAMLAQEKMPVGLPNTYQAKTAHRALLQDTPGFYDCTVTVPDGCAVPPLPVRIKGRIVYPTGTFRGQWALCELSNALDSPSCILEEMHGAILYDSEEVIFADWIQTIFDIRNSAPGGKSSPMGTWAKLYMNALSGKFGARSDNERVLVNPPEVVACNRKLKSCIPRCNGACGAYFPLEGMGDCFVSMTEKVQPCGHIEWAATLTAAARVRWYKRAIAEGDSLVYGDTDSVFVAQPSMLPTSSNLGDWALGKFGYEFVCKAPKVYTFKGENGPVVKAKGIYLPGSKAEAETVIREGLTVRKRAPMGVKSALKNGQFFQTADFTRSLKGAKGIIGSRWVRPDGSTYPMTYKQAMERFG